MHGLQVRPWDGPAPHQSGTYSRFDASFTQTMKLLRRELEMLDARKLLVELDIRDRDIRIDGYPRADARAVGHPGVRVNFESRFGPVRMETAEFTSWQANLRAIALALEALRKVDRYGVSKRGEQYRGYRAIEQTSSDPAASIHSTSDALEVIQQETGLDRDEIMRSVPSAIRDAIKTSHPDAGGTDDRFRRVMRAKELLAP